MSDTHVFLFTICGIGYGIAGLFWLASKYKFFENLLFYGALCVLIPLAALFLVFKSAVASTGIWVPLLIFFGYRHGFKH